MNMECETIHTTELADNDAPSPEEIAAVCKEIQANWSRGERARRRKRAGTAIPSWSVPIYRTPAMPLN